MSILQLTLSLIIIISTSFHHWWHMTNYFLNNGQRIRVFVFCWFLEKCSTARFCRCCINLLQYFLVELLECLLLFCCFLEYFPSLHVFVVVTKLITKNWWMASYSSLSLIYEDSGNGHKFMPYLKKTGNKTYGSICDYSVDFINVSWAFSNLGKWDFLTRTCLTMIFK